MANTKRRTGKIKERRVKVKDFKKISFDEFEKVYSNVKEPRDILCDNVLHDFNCEVKNYEISLIDSMTDCESPIEQMLAMEFERIRLIHSRNFNPYIDIVDVLKQETIECGKNKYRVDFLIPVNYLNQGGVMYVVECDGHEFHQKTKEQVERDNERIRDLQKNGYEVIRFSGAEIYHKSYECALEVLRIIISKCKYIKEK